MFAQQYGPWAVIAGGSEGVGVSFARKFAAEGINLVLLARKPGPLEETAERIRAEFGVEVRTLALDLVETETALESLRAVTDPLEIGMLVYNAGTDNRAVDFLDRSVEGALRNVALNVVGQTRFAHHFGGRMRERGRGGIILVGSVSGLVGGGSSTIYSAAKAFSHTFAKGLWYELKPFGIHVLGLVLGATRTPAAERAMLKTDHPDFKLTEPEEVVREGLQQLAVGPLWIVSDAAEQARTLMAMSDAEAVESLGASTKAMLPVRRKPADAGPFARPS